MGTKQSRNGFLENGGADLLKDLACNNNYNGGNQPNLDMIMNNRFNNPYGLGPYQIQMSHQQQIDAAKMAGISTNDLIIGSGARLMRGTTDASKNGETLDEYDSRTHRTSMNGSVGNYKRKPGSGSFYPPANRNVGENWRNSYYQKSSSKAPTKSTMLQELLECPICMNLFDNPHVLPCQHTFCKKCIISLQGADASESNGNSSTANNSSNNTISCPICRESHRLPNGIEGLSANYTMKRLIELESMTEKEKSQNKSKEKAKCFLCQNYGYLKVCEDCSYMLCVDCIDDPDHDIRIDLKMKAKVRSTSSNSQTTNFATMVKAQSRYAQPIHDYSGRCDLYAERIQPPSNKVKLILLCHSSAVEAMTEKTGADKQQDMQQSITSAVGVNGGKYEVYEDEYGKCTTFSKINIPTNDRVITLKKIVETKFGISCNDQILVYKDNVLKNDLKPLHHYRLRQFSRIHIFDQRDIKDNASDDELFGIYQDANIAQSPGDSLPNANKRPQGLPTPNLSENRKVMESSMREVGSLQQQMQQHVITERMPASTKYTKMTRVEDYRSPRSDRRVRREHSKSHHSAHPHNSNSDESSDSYDFEEISGAVDYKPVIKRTQMCNSLHVAPSSASQYKRHNSVSRVRKLDELFDQQISLANQ